MILTIVTLINKYKFSLKGYELK